MCGIAGIWSKKNGKVPEGHIIEMLQSLTHRGPDAQGVWSRPGLALGNRRLKILDLSDTANQPFLDGEDVLVFNGRIFNHLALKKELSDRFSFKTTCDTEVLLRALQVWDEKALDRIEGQFAFAFYRGASHTLMLARDHVGICPLYVLDTQDALYFSSEIRPLLSLQKCTLNGSAVVDYFTYRYNIQNGRTFFKEIRRFSPAHFLKIDLNTKSMHERRYWRLDFNETEASNAEFQKEFNRILDDEISAQRIVDVPVGMYLSGGIDSGALLKGFSSAKIDINSFTLSFSKKDSDYSRVLELAKDYKFKKNLIEFSENDLDRIEEVVSALEDPFGDMIICANYLLAEQASRQIKVVLSGEGGDESFCGYDHQRAFFKLQEFLRFPLAKLSLVTALNILPPAILGRLQSYPGKFGPNEVVRIRNVVERIQDPAQAYVQMVSLFDLKDLPDLFSEKFKAMYPLTPDMAPFREIFEKESNSWRAIMRAEIEQLTLIVNLIKQDRFAMHFSMEGCVPLVSRRVLQFAASLPYNMQYSRTNKELLLNYSGHSKVKKKPFSLFATPQYLDKLIKLMDAYVSYDRVLESSVLSWQHVQRIRNELVSGDLLVIKQAMAIVIFMVWWKCFSPFFR